MTENDLNKIPINELFDLMLKSTQDLIDFTSIKNETEYEAKKEELQLIQRILVERRAGFSPVVSTGI